MAATALVAVLCLLGFAGRDSASAADGETAQLISYFNSYRAQNGVGSLTTSSSLNSDAQQAANQSAQSCSFQLPSGSGKKWGAYAYVTAAQLWQAYQEDPITLPWIADPKYHSVGVGRAYSDNCNLGHIWIIWLSTVGSGSTPAPTSTPTPTATTPATATPQPTVTAQPTTTATPVATPTPAPTATPFVQLHGDVNCDGVVNLLDAIEMMRLIGGAEADAECAKETGVDCTGGINEADVLALMRFLGGIPGAIPDDCPAIDAPVPSETVSPSPTLTAAPSTETPTAAPGSGSGVTDYCWLGIIAYDMTYPEVLVGDHACQPDDGPAYTCSFPGDSKQGNCSTDADGFSPYDCYVFNSVDVPCVATEGPDSADYVCARGEPPITCTSEAAPNYDCTVESDLVSCSGPADFTWPPPSS